MSAHIAPVEIPIFETLRRLVEQVWQIEPICNQNGRPRPYPLYSLLGPLASDPATGQEWLGLTVAGLLEQLKGNSAELSRQAALLYFRPFNWIEPYIYDHLKPEAQRFPAVARGQIMQTVLAHWLQAHPTNITRALLAERLETLLRGPGSKWKPDLHRPTISDCLDMLLADPGPNALQMLSQLMAGALGQVTEGSVEEPELRRAAPAIYLRLWEAGKFDYHIFRQAMNFLPGVFHELSRPLVRRPAFFRKLPVSFAVQLQSFALQLATELAENLPSGHPQEAALLKKAGYLEGASWLLLACSYVEEKGLLALPGIRSTQIEAAATRLCHTHRPVLSLEDDAHTIEFLTHFKPDTLRAILPHAPAYRDLIEVALQSGYFPPSPPPPPPAT